MRFTCDTDQLKITLEGMERLWALKRELRISRATIATINFVPHTPAMQDFKGYLRFPGTAIPWRFLAGTYIRQGKREFWYLHLEQPGVLTIDLLPGAYAYDRVRLTCRPEIAQDIVDWWREGK